MTHLAERGSTPRDIQSERWPLPGTDHMHTCMHGRTHPRGRKLAQRPEESGGRRRPLIAEGYNIKSLPIIAPSCTPTTRHCVAPRCSLIRRWKAEAELSNTVSTSARKPHSGCCRPRLSYTLHTGPCRPPTTRPSTSYHSINDSDSALDSCSAFAQAQRN